MDSFPSSCPAPPFPWGGVLKAAWEEEEVAAL